MTVFAIIMYNFINNSKIFTFYCNGYIISIQKLIKVLYCEIYMKNA